ncbi:MAG: anti-sigma B factor antagonist RsbV [Roseibaca calidilacus]|uniref:Anti-sigma factor antagonist n=1 Tax=Roseibaca calidilacus TaxID=1666912 RepID=A0A0P8A9I9_9RHOB|nr:STAS domain-containing protein [Roseibaca calidilacus]KPP90828.1 MAG: anti-sigma B factor antagonist RsbV [Roseibaca calidilacus]CUX83632.1 anti-sigma B factor antagonist [Roseibaca calidilacus]
MQMTLGEAGGALVIELRETRLDAAVAIRFKDAIRSATAHPGSPVILDLGKVEFMDSSGLGAIVGAMKLLGPERPLEIAALSPGVRKVFRLTRMDTVFRIHDRAPDAQALPAAG